VVAQRVRLKNRCKARAYAACVAGAAQLFGVSAAAADGHVGNQCPRLSAAAYEELDARVLLLLKSEGGSRPLPTVVCNDIGSWLEWDGRRFEILGRGPLQDEVVDLLEAALHDAERKADADPRATEDAAIAEGRPMLEQGSGAAPRPPALGQPASRVAQRASDARGGGLTLGMETEIPSDTIATSVGPSFDFGTNVGPMILGGREAFRFTVEGRQVSFMDFEAAAGYGAPLDPDKALGAVLRFGAEWMVAFPEGNSSQAAVVPVADLGLRMAHSFGLLGVWLGADAHWRLETLTLRSRTPLIANELGVSFSVGVSFVDWSRK
jgi:hypothetical protein